MTDARATGEALARSHRPSDGYDADRSLLNLAESARAEGWSLRSSLVRFAQREPERAGALLESVRRVDRALHPLRRHLERHVVETDRGPDVRAAEVAALLELGPEGFGPAFEAYSGAIDEPLSDEEQHAVPLLGVAHTLDRVADELAEWATTAKDEPPVAAVDEAIAVTAARLDALGVPREQGPPDRAGRRR